MSPELKKRMCGGAFNIDELSYDSWKSDVYSLGLTLIDILTLSVRDETISIEKKIQTIADIYGNDYKSLIEKMIIEDPKERLDFCGLINSREFQSILGNSTEILREKQVIFLFFIILIYLPFNKLF